MLHQVYEVVGEIAGLDKETVLLDVCCGTGTIGLCLAAKCKQVRNVLQTILKGNTYRAFFFEMGPSPASFSFILQTNITLFTINKCEI